MASTCHAAFLLVLLSTTFLSTTGMARPGSIYVVDLMQTTAELACHTLTESSHRAAVSVV